MLSMSEPLMITEPFSVILLKSLSKLMGSKWNQAINILFRSRSRDQDEFWVTNTNLINALPRILSTWLSFCPLNSHWIKRSRASEQSDQAIKDDFHRSRLLIPVANPSTGDVYVTTPWTRTERKVDLHVDKPLSFSEREGYSWLGTNKLRVSVSSLTSPQSLACWASSVPSTLAEHLQYPFPAQHAAIVISFPDPPRKAERGSGVTSDNSCHNGLGRTS